MSKSTLRPGRQNMGIQDLTKDDSQCSLVEHCTPMPWHQLDETPSEMRSVTLRRYGSAAVAITVSGSVPFSDGTWSV